MIFVEMFIIKIDDALCLSIITENTVIYIYFKIIHRAVYSCTVKVVIIVIRKIALVDVYIIMVYIIQ